ncbi:MAG: rhomboid family intramembrane serine protease [Bacteroidia bacterium]|nr:rhomboid family intramembrane serine protease [Bacteroidia bacterium]
MKIRYNAPTTLNFTFICVVILGIQSIFFPFDADGTKGVMQYFTVPPYADFTNPIWYFQLFSHVMGHANWNHLYGNFGVILLIGPILEEKYGSRNLAIMILITALVTGILNVVFFSTGLLGASGVLFMMIVLASFTQSKGGIPLTFILVVLLYLGREIYNIFQDDQVSQFAHLVGGILGGLFGFFLQGGSVSVPKAERKK